MADRYDKRVFVEQQLLVSELAGNIYKNRYTAQGLYYISTDQSGMIRGATRYNIDIFDRLKPLFRYSLFLENYIIALNSGIYKILYYAGLFVDLFKHEMLIALFFGLFYIPVYARLFLG